MGNCNICNKEESSETSPFSLQGDQKKSQSSNERELAIKLEKDDDNEETTLTETEMEEALSWQLSELHSLRQSLQQLLEWEQHFEALSQPILLLVLHDGDFDCSH